MRTTCFLTMLACALFVPPTAAAAVDVTSDGTGGVRVAGADPAEVVTIERTASGMLRVREASTTVTSSDAACAPDVEQPTAVACTVTGAAAVTVLLGAGADELDARTARGVALVVNGGAGSDTLRVGASGSVRVSDATTSDVIDLSHADAAVRVRYGRAVARLVASCGGCATRWSVRLPAVPGRVLLGSHGDDVDLVAWRTRGRTAWILGPGEDRFFGSPIHRSIADGGAGIDSLVSRAAADVLRGGAGMDKLADLGGAGDVLQGGADTDAISALDRRRDTLDGGGARDMCLSPNRTESGCGEGGPVRNVELSVYTPIATQAQVFAMLGIR